MRAVPNTTGITIPYVLVWIRKALYAGTASGMEAWLAPNRLFITPSLQAKIAHRLIR